MASLGLLLLMLLLLLRSLSLLLLMLLLLLRSLSLLLLVLLLLFRGLCLLLLVLLLLFRSLRLLLPFGLGLLLLFRGIALFLLLLLSRVRRSTHAHEQKERARTNHSNLFHDVASIASSRAPVLQSASATWPVIPPVYRVPNLYCLLVNRRGYARGSGTTQIR